MKVLLRNSRGLYFQGLDQWTSQASEAFDFGNIDDAVELARGVGLQEAEVWLSLKTVPSEIRFPLAAPALQGTSVLLAGSAAAPLLPSKSILVVDGDLMIAKTLQVLQTITKPTVEVANDGEKALAMYLSHRHDLIITEFILPGMDGLRLAGSIKECSPKVPIIMTTADAAALTNLQKRRRLVDVVLPKPFSTEQLQEAVFRALPGI